MRQLGDDKNNKNGRVTIIRMTATIIRMTDNNNYNNKNNLSNKNDRYDNKNKNIKLYIFTKCKY